MDASHLLHIGVHGWCFYLNLAKTFSAAILKNSVKRVYLLMFKEEEFVCSINEQTKLLC